MQIFFAYKDVCKLSYFRSLVATLTPQPQWRITSPVLFMLSTCVSFHRPGKEK